jgi:hypothetical protein
MKTKLIVQFIYKSQDESFKSSYFMIELNKNENTIISKSKNFSNLNNARFPSRWDSVVMIRPAGLGPYLSGNARTPTTMTPDLVGACCMHAPRLFRGIDAVLGVLWSKK